MALTRDPLDWVPTLPHKARFTLWICQPAMVFYFFILIFIFMFFSPAFPHLSRFDLEKKNGMHWINDIASLVLGEDSLAIEDEKGEDEPRPKSHSFAFQMQPISTSLDQADVSISSVHGEGESLSIHPKGRNTIEILRCMYVQCGSNPILSAFFFFIFYVYYYSHPSTVSTCIRRRLCMYMYMYVIIPSPTFVSFHFTFHPT